MFYFPLLVLSLPKGPPMSLSNRSAQEPAKVITHCPTQLEQTA